MKKHELLKYAYDNYPKGTKFKNLSTGKENISIGKFEVRTFGIVTSEEVDGGKTLLVRFSGLKWAEIVTEKIAVRVDNEREFNHTIEYLKSKGWNLGANNGIKWSSWTGKPLLVEIYENAETVYESFKDGSKLNNHQIIPFTDFAKDKGIRVPIITTFDGVDLFNGDKLISVNIDGLYIGNDDFVIDEIDLFLPTHKYFSTKQGALDWIEAQKPKEVSVKLTNHIEALINKNGLVKFNIPVFRMDKLDIEAIYKTMNEL